MTTLQQNYVVVLTVVLIGSNAVVQYIRGDYIYAGVNVLFLVVEASLLLSLRKRKARKS